MAHQIHRRQERKVKENLVEVEAAMEGDFIEHAQQCQAAMGR